MRGDNSKKRQYLNRKRPGAPNPHTARGSTSMIVPDAHALNSAVQTTDTMLLSEKYFTYTIVYC